MFASTCPHRRESTWTNPQFIGLAAFAVSTWKSFSYLLATAMEALFWAKKDTVFSSHPQSTSCSAAKDGPSPDPQLQSLLPLMVITYFGLPSRSTAVSVSSYGGTVNSRREW